MSRIPFWTLLAIAIILGLAITWVDTRPTWDDSGVTAAAIFATTALLGAAKPQHPWIWAFAVGIWVPLWGSILAHNYAPVLALIIAFLGAYAGAFGHKAFATISGNKPAA